MMDSVDDPDLEWKMLHQTPELWTAVDQVIETSRPYIEAITSQLVFAWHAHHEQWFDVYPSKASLDDRITTLKEGVKPDYETPRRLRLIKVMENPPYALKIIGAVFNYSVVRRVIDPYGIMDWSRLWRSVISDLPAESQHYNLNPLLYELLDLHNRQCGNSLNHPNFDPTKNTCPWNGETIFPEFSHAYMDAHPEKFDSQGSWIGGELE